MSGDALHPYYPFDGGYMGKAPLMVRDSAERCRLASDFTVAECRAALANERMVLQKTVVRRIQRRLRKLGEVA